MTYDELDAALGSLPAPPERGTVALIVLRRSRGVHDTVDAAEITTDDGLVGDRWSADDDPELMAQVTLMNAGVARLLCGESIALDAPGDNLLVDFDIGERALPVGAHVRVGEVTLEVTPEPHLGCKIFRERLGADALRLVNHQDHRPRRLRGVNCRVVTGGRVRVGDAVERVATAEARTAPAMR